MKKIKEICSLKRLVWFFLISGLFLVCYTPHLAYKVDLESTTSGTVILANYNTDRGEEIFESYNYKGHKTWYEVQSGEEEINITTIPIVTNSLQMKLQGLNEMTIRKITINFGPFELKTYTADNLSTSLAGSQGLDISFENNLIHLRLQNTEGWIQLQTEEYMAKTRILLVYFLLFLFAAAVTGFVTKYIEILDRVQLREVMLIAAPCWIFFMSEGVLGNIFYIAFSLRLLNVALMIVIYRIVHLLCRRYSISILISSLIFVMFAIVSTFVVRFRNRPIAPWDFTALKTAMDVASNYEISINYMMISALAVCVILFLVMNAIPKEKERINKWYTVYPILIIVIALFFNSIGSYYLWDIRLLNTFQNEGTALTFTGLVRQYIENQPTKPDGYSEETLNRIYNIYTYEADREVEDDVITPTTIIQIMNESFSDLCVGGTDYAQDITPYFNSLENTIRGNLYVSVRGGGTCNSEYETLTGNTTAFFAAGVYPYNMYMNRDVPSLVSYMNQYGYSTTGIHLGKSTNWNRRTAYQRLNFTDTVFAETFDGLETVHGYPSDAQDFKTVIEQYEANQGTKQYIFNVTYQNHGSYANSNDLPQTVNLSSYGYGNYDNAENYLSLLKLTDAAFEDLITYFSNVDENVMIIMYGDHQPSLGSTCDKLFFPYAGSPEQDIKEYITPFLIWANYDIEDGYYEKLSSNYLSSLILKAANMEMTPYQEFLYQLKDEYPVISLYGCYDKDGRFYESVDDIEDDDINTYRILQYNNVFDSDRKESLFWPDGTDDNEETAE